MLAEGTCFWNALQRQSPMLAEETTSAYRSHGEALQALEATRVATLVASRSFFQPHVEISYILPLAIQFGYIPANVDVLALGSQELASCRVANAGCSDFLKSARSDDGFVRGAREPFPDDGPACKYMALFDARPVFDALRLQFLVRADPQSEVNSMMEALG